VWCPVVAIVMNAHLALRISETGSTDRASVRLGDAGDKWAGDLRDRMARRQE